MKADNRSPYSYERFLHAAAGKVLAAWLEKPAESRGRLSILSTGNAPFPDMLVVLDDERLRPTLSCSLDGTIVEILFWAKNPRGQGPYRFKWHVGGRVVPSRETRVSHGLYDPKAEYEYGVWEVTIATPVVKTESDLQ